MLSACIVSGIVGVGFGIAIFMTYLSNETTAVSSARLFDISFGSVILGAAMFGITLIGTASMFEKKAD